MTRHKAFSLYLLVVVFVFVSFVLGLMIGTESVKLAEQGPSVTPHKPVEDLDETQLDFYEELAKPIEKSEPAEAEIVLTETKPAPEAVKQEKVPEERKSDGLFTIQVAAHSTREEAEQLRTRLGAKGFQGRIREPDTATGDKYYRVWVGDFSSSGEAEDYAEQLKDSGFHTYIRKTQ